MTEKSALELIAEIGTLGREFIATAEATIAREKRAHVELMQSAERMPVWEHTDVPVSETVVKILCDGDAPSRALLSTVIV